MKRRIFYSFHYKLDSWRTSQVRNIGVVEGSRPATDNGWEEIKRGGDTAIKRWINAQLENRTCTVVLVGSNTANREWINYEVMKSWNKGMGVVGIYIHGLKDSNGYISIKGMNPFDYVYFNDGRKLSAVVQCYDPTGRNSTQRYDWISKNLSSAVEEAISIRNNH
ncbi:MAG: TIR domain-containing protein [Bacteroidota bacterium]|nr:TIR domain-containing protein [Bacteroidota bacterium]